MLLLLDFRDCFCLHRFVRAETDAFLGSTSLFVERVPYPCRVILRLLKSRAHQELTHTLARVTQHLSSCCPHQHHGTLRLPGLALANGCGLQMTSAYVMALTSSSPIIRHFLPTIHAIRLHGKDISPYLHFGLYRN